MDKTRILALIAVTLVHVIYGLTFTFANDVLAEGYIKPYGFLLVRVVGAAIKNDVLAEGYIKPYGFLLVRVVGAAILFWIFSLFTVKEPIAAKDYITIFFAAVFGLGLNFLTFFKGLEFTTPIHASVIMTVVPIVVLLLSAFFLKERVTGLKIIGISLGLSGAIVLSVYGKSPHPTDQIPLGNLLIFINAVSYSIYIIII